MWKLGQIIRIPCDLILTTMTRDLLETCTCVSYSHLWLSVLRKNCISQHTHKIQNMTRCLKLSSLLLPVIQLVVWLYLKQTAESPRGRDQRRQIFELVETSAVCGLTRCIQLSHRQHDKDVVLCLPIRLAWK